MLLAETSDLLLLCMSWLRGVIVGQDWRVSGNLPNPPPGQVTLFGCQLMALCLLCMVVRRLTPPFFISFSGAVDIGATLPNAPRYQSYYIIYIIIVY